MDEDALAAALRRATDDVQVPKDLVRGAERLGRERRARRRSWVAALAVVAVVLVGGGALALHLDDGGGATSATSASAGASSAPSSAAADSADARAGASDESGRSSPGAAGGPAGAAAESAPRAGSAEPLQGRARPSAADGAGCLPVLLVDGSPQPDGAPAVTVRPGAELVVSGAPLTCAATPRGSRLSVTLTSSATASLRVVTEVVPATDGSFSARVTVPAWAPPGPARLSVAGTAQGQLPCPPRAACGVDLDVLPSLARSLTGGGASG